jgi:hypothetical protein
MIRGIKTVNEFKKNLYWAKQLTRWIQHNDIHNAKKKKTDLRANYLHGDEPFFRSRQLLSYSRISQHFMELEGLLSSLQEPSVE